MELAVLLLQSGQTEQHNVFCTDDGLLENYWPTAWDGVRRQNTDAVIDFAKGHDVPVCAVVAPTAAAVKQFIISPIIRRVSARSCGPPHISYRAAWGKPMEGTCEKKTELHSNS